MVSKIPYIEGAQLTLVNKIPYIEGAQLTLVSKIPYIECGCGLVIHLLLAYRKKRFGTIVLTDAKGSVT